MKLTTNDEERIRLALGVLVATTPIGEAFEDLERGRLTGPAERARRTASIALAAFVAVIVAIAPVTLLMSDETQAPEASAPGTTAPIPVATSGPVPTSVPVPSTTVPSTTMPSIEAGGFEGFTMVHSIDSAGQFVGSRDGVVWISADGGKSWETLRSVDHDLDLLGIAPDGAILAIRNPNEVVRDELGPNSVTNRTPEVHRYDPGRQEWEIIPLPRPELPIADLAAAPMDGTGTCGLGGLKSWVNGIAIAVGREIVIVGDHRVVGQDICDEDFQFLWVSSDGTDWSLVPEIGLDGFLAGIHWTGEQYVGYGSARPSYIGGGGPLPLIWTTVDLATWTPQALDLSVLPEDTFVPVGPSLVGDATGPAVQIDQPEGGAITLLLQVLGPLAELGTGVADIDALRQWLAETGALEQLPADVSLDENLDYLGVDFPLDAAEIKILHAFFATYEDRGDLLLRSTTGNEWLASYESG